jgi:hypothetical protein
MFEFNPAMPASRQTIFRGMSSRQEGPEEAENAESIATGIRAFITKAFEFTGKWLQKHLGSIDAFGPRLGSAG